MPDYTQFDEDAWLESLWRAMKHHLQDNMPEFGGSPLYELTLGFPDSKEQAQFVQQAKTTIHFEIDDISSPPFGLGDNIVDATYDNTPGAETISPQEAEMSVVNWDVGVWASAKSGGVSSRLSAYQSLYKVLHGPSANAKIQQERGIEILSFEGGTFTIESIADQKLFRVMGIVLVTRVYPRRLHEAQPYYTSVDQAPGLTIDGTPIS